MIVFKFFLVILVGTFAPHAMSFNPLLTYTVRIKKINVYPNMTVNYTIDQYRDKQFINGYMTLNTKHVVNRVVGVFSRCNQEGFDCEYFQTWAISGLCPKLKQDNQVWSSWYKSFEPPLVCPINKRYYKIVNGSIDIGPIVHLYPDVTNYYWKVLQKTYEDDIFTGSYSLEFSIFGYRKKIKTT